MVVHRLFYADNIVALGPSGEIIEQGNYKQLYYTRGYVRSLSRLQHSKSRLGSNGNSTNEPVVEDSATRLEVERAASDASRRTGDLTIYLYYFKSIGWVYTIYFLFLVIAFAFCITFPSKYRAREKGHPRVYQALKLIRRLGSMVGSCKRDRSLWETRVLVRHLRIHQCFGTAHASIRLLVGIARPLQSMLIILILWLRHMMAVMVPRSANQLHWILLKAVME